MKIKYFLLLILLLVALAPNIDAAVSGSFTHTLRGQILDLNPTLGSDVTYYRWTITNNNSVVGQTYWIPIGERCPTKYHLDRGMDYQVTMGYKNCTESGEFSVTLRVPKGDDETTLSVDTDTGEVSPYKKLFGEYSPAVNQWISERNPGEWFVLIIVALIVIFILHKSRQKKRYFVVKEVKENER